MYFDNNASSCNHLRAVPEISMSSSSRVSHPPERVQAAALTCVGKDAKIGLTDTFWPCQLDSSTCVSLRFQAARPVGSAEMRNMASLVNIGFGHTQPDQLVNHDPIKDKHNSQIINAWRFHTTAAAIGRQRSARPTSHDVQSDKNGCFWHFSDLARSTTQVRDTPISGHRYTC